mmetsp:Transcript_10939/g.9665  ORF Transcript_10939/g.9665 Transcript_10939/m.9665 type:complete len:235 (+) Transcript_10939:780-1484(+)
MIKEKSFSPQEEAKILAKEDSKIEIIEGYTPKDQAKKSILKSTQNHEIPHKEASSKSVKFEDSEGESEEETEGDKENNSSDEEEEIDDWRKEVESDSSGKLRMFFFSVCDQNRLAYYIKSTISYQNEDLDKLDIFTERQKRTFNKVFVSELGEKAYMDISCELERILTYLNYALTPIPSFTDSEDQMILYCLLQFILNQDQITENKDSIEVWIKKISISHPEAVEYINNFTLKV